MPLTLRAPRDAAVLTPQTDPKSCLPYWDWQVANLGAYNPYIVQPDSLAADKFQTLTFYPVSTATWAPLTKSFKLALNDQEGDEVVSDYPGTVQQWVRDSKPKKRFCLLFLTRAIAQGIGLPDECMIAQPEDKWPVSAAGGRDKLLSAILKKVVKAHESSRAPGLTVVEVDFIRRFLDFERVGP